MAWQPFFEKRPTDLAAQATFLGHVQTLDSLGRRRWDRGAWRDELAAVPDSAPGPDGLCYSFWSRTPCDWTSLIFGLAERLADASDPRVGFLIVWQSSYPKEKPRPLRIL